MLIDSEFIDKIEIKNADGEVIAVISDDDTTAYDGYELNITLGEFI